MLRELITHAQKAAEATYKAATAMKTGMAVVKNVDGTASFPSADTAANLYFTQKARVPSGINASRTNMSDYDEDYNAILAEEPVVLCQYSAGEKIAIDGASALTDADKGKVLMAGTDGMMVVSTVASLYRYEGAYNDAGGHSLAKILILDTPVENT